MELKAGMTIHPSMIVEEDMTISEQAQEKDLVFSVKPLHVIEAHLYHVSEFANNAGDIFRMFPVLYEKEGKLVLESAFGAEKEDQVIATEAYVEAL